MPSTDLEGRSSEPSLVSRYKKEYVARRKRQAISVIPVGALAAAVALGGGGLLGLGESAVLVVVGAVVLAFFGFSIANWRCPACDSYLGQRLNPRECPACGQMLRD